MIQGQGKCFFTFLILLFFFTGCGNREDRKNQDRPNILLISLDTLGAGHLNCYGYEKELSPAMDALAARGALFENTYSQCPRTLPSHASMLSSLYPTSHGATYQIYKIPDKILLLSQILKKEGYQTASFNASGQVSAEFGFDRGFDLYEEMSPLTMNIEDICDRVSDWLKKNHGNPFFLFFHTYEIHYPYAAPIEYKEKYFSLRDMMQKKLNAFFLKVIHDETLVLEDYAFFAAIASTRGKKELEDEWAALAEKYDTDVQQLNLSEKWLQKRLKKLKNLALTKKKNEIFDYCNRNMDSMRWVFKYMIDGYDAEIIFTDHQIARLLGILKGLGLEEKTLIVLTSDHGEEFGEHGDWGHGKTGYNEAIRVPLIFYYPGRIPEGLRIKENAALIDIPPTILEFIGVESPAHFQGISLVPLMKRKKSTNRLIFTDNLDHRETYQPCIVIDGKWKYHYDTRGLMPDELYNVAQDPLERVNLAQEEAEISLRLQNAVKEHLKASAGIEKEKLELDDALEGQLKDLGYIE